MNNIFNSLNSYIPSVGRNPQEDYLTQLFAWMLDNVPKLGAKFCQFLLDKLETGKKPAFPIAMDEKVTIQTQFPVNDGRVDMLLTLGQYIFICEHKVMSSLRDQQIDGYARSFSSYTDNYFTVLITATTLQHTQSADIRLIWADVYDFLLDEQKKHKDEFGFLLDHFINFLQLQGLGRTKPITMENILGFLPGKELPVKVQRLLQVIVDRNWSTTCPGIQALNSASLYRPQFISNHYGRMGIDFFPQKFDGWHPGLFAGILFDGTDHAINFIDKSLGPDIVIFLDFDYFPKQNDENEKRAMTRRSSYLGHRNYMELCGRLKSESGQFRFQGEVKGNPWRIIVLQQPLVKVINSTKNEDEQLDSLFESFCQGIKLITQDNLLAEIPHR